MCIIGRQPAISASTMFGNIVLVDTAELRLLLVLDVLVVVLAVVFYQPLLAICFDEEFARLRGLNVERYVYLLLILVALTVVLLVSVVGIVLVIALIFAVALPLAGIRAMIQR